MTPERWQQVKSVLAEALEEAPANRPACLERSCAGDEDLRREVELCLEHERGLSPRFLNETALPRVAASVLTAGALASVGRRMGAYQTVELIGVGGMGEVYRGFRADDEYRKEVALKVVRVGQDSSVILARFRNERQILASLEHPNIARLLDGGTTEEGAPYLVMELIEGEPIEKYCDSRKLSISDRLALFTRVCAAVQYAHQRLIIHRDIKPSNILVTPDGVPKLLDFGIAKVLGTDLQSQSTETLTVFRVLTPGYASPEQIKGDPVTTASDVYSLGVVLYELLTARSPYAATTGAPQELLRQICELEPEKPSVATDKPTRDPSADPLTAEEVSAARKTSPLKLRKQLKGDLDNIVLMALRKEPSRRYASVEQFAEDVRRNLAMLPVVAQRDTAGYRVSKFVARHRAGVLAAVTVGLALVAGIIITMRETQLANRRFNDVRGLTNSLIFDVHDSIKDLTGSTPAKKIIVERALQYLNVLAQESSGDTGLQRDLASAYEKLGSVQGDYLENNLGDAEGTLTSYKKALELRKQIESRSRDWNDRLALAIAYRLVAHQQWANGDARIARSTIAHAIEISQSLNKAHPNNPKIVDELGFDFEVSGRTGYPGDPQERQRVIEDYRQALALGEIEVKISPNDERVLHGYSMSLSDLGIALEPSDPPAALAIYKKALEIDLRLTALSDDVRYRRGAAIDYGSIGSVFDDLGDYQRSADNYEKDLAIYLDLTRSDPKNILFQQGLAITYVNTGIAHQRAGHMGLAVEDSGKGVEIMRGIVSSATPKAAKRTKYAALLAAHGTILTAAGKIEPAITDLESARSIYQSFYEAGTTDNHTNVAACDVKLGEAAAKAGRDQQAQSYFQQALALAEPLIATGAPDLSALYAAADAYSGLGSLSVREAKPRSRTSAQRKTEWTEARSWYEESVKTWQRIDRPNHTAPNSFQVGDPVTAKKQLELAENALASLR